jgi:hypothetical protein
VTDQTGTTFAVETPCPDCGQRSLIGYLLVNESGRHQHTRYACTFWRSGLSPDGLRPLHEPCGWQGWSVPAPARCGPGRECVGQADDHVHCHCGGRCCHCSCPGSGLDPGDPGPIGTEPVETAARVNWWFVGWFLFGLLVALVTVEVGWLLAWWISPALFDGRGLFLEEGG